MRRRRTTLLVLAAVPVALLLSMPLRWPAATLLDQQHLPLVAIEATGSMWSGQLRGMRWRDASLGDVALRVQPLALLRGQLRVRLRGAAWSAVTVRGMRHGIADAAGRMPLPLAVPADTASLVLEARELSVLFDATQCREAAGSVRIHVVPTDEVVPPSMLAGQPRCDGDAVVVDLAGSGDAPAPGHARLRLDHAGRYRLDLQVGTASPTGTLALQLAGFTDATDGTLVRAIEGTLGE